jgi:hypothetical protein
MTPQQIELVQTRFKKVVPIATTAADLFYDRLFVIAPETRTLFPLDLTQQKGKLMSMLRTAVTTTRRSARPCCGRSRTASAPTSRST